MDGGLKEKKMNINIEIKGQQAHIVNQQSLISGTSNLEEIKFDFSSEWNGYTKTAVIYVDDYSISDSVKVLVEKDVVSAEKLPDWLFREECELHIGVFGDNSEGRRITSTIVCQKVKKGVPVDVVNEITPDIYNQIIKIMCDAKALVKEADEKIEVNKGYLEQAEQKANDAADYADRAGNYLEEVVGQKTDVEKLIANIDVKVEESTTNIANITEAKMNDIANTTNAKLGDINNTVRAQIDSINNVTNQTTKSGIDAVNAATQAQIDSINNVTTAKMKDIANVTNAKLGDINNTAQAQISAINKTAQAQASAIEKQGNEIKQEGKEILDKIENVGGANAIVPNAALIWNTNKSGTWNTHLTDSAEYPIKEIELRKSYNNTTTFTPSLDNPPQLGFNKKVTLYVLNKTSTNINDAVYSIPFEYDLNGCKFDNTDYYNTLTFDRERGQIRYYSIVRLIKFSELKGTKWKATKDEAKGWLKVQYDTFKDGYSSLNPTRNICNIAEQGEDEVGKYKIAEDNNTIILWLDLTRFTSLQDWLDYIENNDVQLLTQMFNGTSSDISYNKELLEKFLKLQTYNLKTSFILDNKEIGVKKVTYAADIKTYIDNKMAELQALLLEKGE